MAELTIGLDVENIGPHSKINFNAKTSSLKTAIYANNGSGKTFISRLFRLIENPINQNSDKLLSFTKNQGKMKFEVKFKEEKKPEVIKSFELKIDKNASPIISSPLPFIFHVFNSDYVHENIEALKYKPDGNIEGYILGKTQINLTKEKKEQIFWHIITRKNTNKKTRDFDKERACRIKWIKSIIENYTKAEIKCFYYFEQSKKIRFYLWLHNHNFAVILQKLGKSISYLVTSFYIDNQKKIDVFLKKFEDYTNKKNVRLNNCEWF